MMDKLKTITIDPGNPTHAVIWLHGLGADAMDFLPILSHLKCQQHTRFIFPEAAMIPVAMNGGAVMHAWYDIGTDFSTNKQQRDQSVQQLVDLIHEQNRLGIANDKIVLAGFSQGGIIAQIAALTGGIKVAGVLGLSTVLHDFEDFQGPNLLTNQHTPWQLMHGQQDGVIRLDIAQKSFATLQSHGFAVDLKVYQMEHTLCPEQIREISLWFDNLLRT